MFYIAFGLLKLQQKYVFIEINFCDCCLQHSGLLLHGKASWEETTLQHFLQSLFSMATTSMYVHQHNGPKSYMKPPHCTVLFV